jgi:hypothetical protein
MTTPQNEDERLREIAENARATWPEPFEWRDDGGWWPDEALHIKTFDPPTVLKLLSDKAALEAERDEWKERALERGVVGANWMDRATTSEARVLELVGALEEAESVIALSEHPSHLDHEYGAEVDALGRRIGFGALMSSASASWREYGEERGLAGSEFTCGPTRATVTKTLALIRSALTNAKGQS